MPGNLTGLRSGGYPAKRPGATLRVPWAGPHQTAATRDRSSRHTIASELAIAPVRRIAGRAHVAAAAFRHLVVDLSRLARPRVPPWLSGDASIDQAARRVCVLAAVSHRRHRLILLCAADRRDACRLRCRVTDRVSLRQQGLEPDHGPHVRLASRESAPGRAQPGLAQPWPVRRRRAWPDAGTFR